MAMSDQHMRDGERNEKTKDNTRPDFVGTTGHRDNSHMDISTYNQGDMKKAPTVGTHAARNVGEQAQMAAATAQDLARRAGEQAYQQGQRAGEYLTRNVNEYPLAALMIAGALGYGVGYLVHSNWQSQNWNGNWSDGNERHDRVGGNLSGRNEGEGSKTAARQYNDAQRRFAESGKVEEKAREAEKSLITERRELDQAEAVGKRHNVAEDPAVTRKY
jgi:hypothetical protein